MKIALSLILSIAAFSAVPLASAAELTYSANHNYAITGAPTTYGFSLSGFDPSLGELTSVTLTYSGSQNITEQFENLSNAGGQPPLFVYNAYYDSGMGLLLPGATAPASGNGPGSGIILDEITTVAADVFALNDTVWGDTSIWFANSAVSFETHQIPAPNTYDGVNDYGGTSGFTLSGTLLTVSRSDTLSSPANLDFFTGPSVTLTGYSGSSAEKRMGGGIAAHLSVISETATVTVTYNYTPVPEPSGTLLVGLCGLIGLLHRSRRA